MPRKINYSDNWHVSVKHVPGSVEHFHHFLLGFFVPLIFQFSTKWERRVLGQVIIRSCDPMDRIIRELGDNRIKIIDRNLHRWIRNRRTRNAFGPQNNSNWSSSTLNFITLRGCDYPRTYNKRKFAQVRDALHTLDWVQSEIRTTAENWARGDAGILLIERDTGDPFYLSEWSEAKESGRERRSIANHQELWCRLRQNHQGCLNVRPEGLTLARQFALFSLADIIIAQHGAALANLIWAKPGVTVIEILPKNLRPDQKIFDLFGNLAGCMGLRYRRVLQEDKHGSVDVKLVYGIAMKTISSPDRKIFGKIWQIVFRLARPLFPALVIYVRIRGAIDKLVGVSWDAEVKRRRSGRDGISS